MRLFNAMLVSAPVGVSYVYLLHIDRTAPGRHGKPTMLTASPGALVGLRGYWPNRNASPECPPAHYAVRFP
jgi:hypothetical protein